MSMLGELTLEDAAHEAAGNWRSWTCFVWDREREIPDSDNWAIIYTFNRDSGLLTMSNADVIAKAMEPFTETTTRMSFLRAMTTGQSGTWMGSASGFTGTVRSPKRSRPTTT